MPSLILNMLLQETNLFLTNKHKQRPVDITIDQKQTDLTLKILKMNWKYDKK